MTEDLLVERSDGLVTITMNRPDRKNAINAAIWDGLDRVLAEVTRTPADRAVLLTGAGGNLSSGAGLARGGTGDREPEPRLNETRRAKQIAFFADMVPADQALAWGSVNEVLPADELPERAGEWVRRLAGGPTTALSLIRRMLDASGSLTVDQALEDRWRTRRARCTSPTPPTTSARA